MPLISDSSFERFEKIKRLKVFKYAVKFKKFFTIRTRFKRRQIMRLKHSRNWLIYYNVFKYWTDEYRIVKRHIRFQYNNRFFVNNSIIFSANQAGKHQDKNYIFQNEWVSATITKKFLNRYSPSSKNLSKGYKGINHVSAFYLVEMFNDSDAASHGIVVFDTQLFATNFPAPGPFVDQIGQDGDLIDNYLFDTSINVVYEIYLILKYNLCFNLFIH